MGEWLSGWASNFTAGVLGALVCAWLLSNWSRRTREPEAATSLPAGVHLEASGKAQVTYVDASGQIVDARQLIFIGPRGPTRQVVRDGGRSGSGPTTPDADPVEPWVLIGLAVVAALLAAVLYLKYAELILLGLATAAAFVSTFVLTSLFIFLRRGVRFRGAVAMNVGMSLSTVAVVVVNLLLVSSPRFQPPEYEEMSAAAKSTPWGDVVAVYADSLPAVFFLLIGLVLGLAALMLATWAWIGLLARIVEALRQLGGRTSTFASLLASRSPDGIGVSIITILVALTSLAFSSGLAFSLLGDDFELPEYASESSLQASARTQDGKELVCGNLEFSSSGKPIPHARLRLELRVRAGGEWRALGEVTTNSSGRVCKPVRRRSIVSKYRLNYPGDEMHRSVISQPVVFQARE